MVCVINDTIYSKDTCRSITSQTGIFMCIVVVVVVVIAVTFLV